jgi:hypothetical protein
MSRRYVVLRMSRLCSVIGVDLPSASQAIQQTYLKGVLSVYVDGEGLRYVLQLSGGHRVGPTHQQCHEW